jgi:DNA-binding CsgD family transcriptional regulator
VSAPAVFGRDAELAAGDALLRTVPDGAVALVVDGEAGIGKTTVWRKLADCAAGRSYRLLSCRPAESETKLSYAGLADLLEVAADEVLPVLPDPQRRALEVALLRAEPAPGQGDQRAAATAFLSALDELARSGPVLVCVDDVQWLDGPSAQVLEFAARRLGTRPVGVLLSLRSTGDGPVPLGLDRALPQARLQRLVVGPLSLGAVHRLLVDRLGISLPRPTLTRVHVASGGNPFYALELARALEGRELHLAPGEPLPIPANLQELVEARLAGLPAPVLEVLALAALVADPSVSLLVEASTAPRTVGRRLEEAAAAGLVELHDERVRFAHPLLASALVALVDRDRLRKLHGRLADAVADPEARARHLGFAAAGPSESVAAELDAAASRAAARGAPAVAAELSELAARLTSSRREDDRLRRRLQAARFHLTAGQLQPARAALEQLVDQLPASSDRAAALLLLAETRHDDLEASRELGEQALREAQGDSQLAETNLLLADMSFLEGDAARGIRHARAAAEAAERADEPALLAFSLCFLCRLELYSGVTTLGLLERAVAIEERLGDMPVSNAPSALLAERLGHFGSQPEAQPILERLYRKAVDQGDEQGRAQMLLRLAGLAHLAGDWTTIDRYLAEGYELAEQGGLEQPKAFLLGFDALLAVERGRAHAARELIGRSRKLAGQSSLLGGMHAQVLGLLELTRGDAAAAERHLAPMADLFEARGMSHYIGRLSLLPDLIESRVALGKLDEAAATLEQLERAHRDLGGSFLVPSAARCRGLLEAARGDLPAALASLARALSEHERLEVPFELGRTLLVQGRIHRRAKQKRAAREAFERALELFEGLGALPWAEQARADLDRVGLRPPSPDGLTPTEQRVAELAAAGLTNRKIADAVFLAPKSVENVVARIYRKLGVGSRAELATKMAETGSTSRT